MTKAPRKELLCPSYKDGFLGFSCHYRSYLFWKYAFGQYSLDTLLSLEATKEELNKKISFLKEQNAKAQKDYFELQGLYPNEN